MLKWLLAIADDLTGALEVGACFAGALVTTDRRVTAAPTAPVLVIDTETRHLPAGEAATIVQRTVRAAWRFNPWLIYKKTDSTLRGNIAAEFRALVTAAPGRPLVYAPAYPEMGRTVKGGRLFVHGIPVHQTAFAADALNPVRGSNIHELLAGVPVTVLDGESAADLEAAAREIIRHNPPTLAAGTAGLAAALAACLGWQPRELLRPPVLSRCLVVNGSMHPVSIAQMEFAHVHGCFDNKWISFAGAPAGEGRERAAATGEHVRRILDETVFDAVIVFGGDTVFGIHRALGSHHFQPYGEVVPGVPLSRSGDLFWLTKAGGFGAPGILCEISKLCGIERD